MSMFEDAKSLGKMPHIKRLKKKISISDFEKAVIVGLKKKEKSKVLHRERQYV